MITKFFARATTLAVALTTVCAMASQAIVLNTNKLTVTPSICSQGVNNNPQAGFVNAPGLPLQLSVDAGLFDVAYGNCRIQNPPVFDFLQFDIRGVNDDNFGVITCLEPDGDLDIEAGSLDSIPVLNVFANGFETRGADFDFYGFDAGDRVRSIQLAQGDDFFVSRSSQIKNIFLNRRISQRNNTVPTVVDCISIII